MKTSSPRVSIITIFLNAEQFLDEAVRSVLDQSFADWELLLVDDGSSDGSREMARRYAADDPRIVYLEHQGHVNKGMPASRNLGLAHARGEYLALLDADDVWRRERLAEHVGNLDARPDAAMVYGPSLYWFSWAEQVPRRDYLQRLGLEGDQLVAPPELLLGFLSGSVPTPCPSSILIRTEIAQQAGGFVEEMKGFFQVYEDQAFFFKICLRWPVFVSSRNVDFYRRHENSCYSQARTSGRKQLAKQHYLKWCLSRLSAREPYPPSVKKEVRRQLWLCRHPRLARIQRKQRTLLNQAGGLLRRFWKGRT